MGASFVWFDLTTTPSGGDGVRDFYTQLFGWTISPGMGDYQSFVTDGEQPWAGIVPGDPATAGRWIPYLVVDDLDAAAKQAAAPGRQHRPGQEHRAGRNLDRRDRSPRGGRRTVHARRRVTT